MLGRSLIRLTRQFPFIRKLSFEKQGQMNRIVFAPEVNNSSFQNRDIKSSLLNAFILKSVLKRIYFFTHSLVHISTHFLFQILAFLLHKEECIPFVAARRLLMEAMDGIGLQ